jgi:excisionase family DNA binding protein
VHGTKDKHMTGTLLTSVTNTAEDLGIGRTKVYQLINSGALATVKIGSRTLVVAESVKKFVANSIVGVDANGR